jgi:tRNA 2-thiouridine synthesizing protein A
MASRPRREPVHERHLVAETVLDTRGLSCPLPVLRARKAMQKLSPGALLQVLATDPGTVKDMQAFCLASGHELVESRTQEDEFHFLLRKA